MPHCYRVGGSASSAETSARQLDEDFHHPSADAEGVGAHAGGAVGEAGYLG